MSNDPDLLATPPPPVGVDQAQAIGVELYGVSGRTTPLDGERDRNFLIEGPAGPVVLKVAHPAEETAVLEMQQAVLEHLQLWDPGLPVPRAIPTLGGEPTGFVSIGGVRSVARMVGFLPGRTVEEVGFGSALRHDAMRVLARLGLALRSFDHPSQTRRLLWDLGRVLELRPQTRHLPDRQRPVVVGHLDRFERRVAPRLAGLRRQNIHNDFNPANLIVDPLEPSRLGGVIDFGDMIHGPLVADVAVAAAYQCLGRSDPATIIAQSAAAYHQVSPLTEDEAGLVADLVLTRLVQSRVIAQWRSQLHPENRDYILTHSEAVWDAISALTDFDPLYLRNQVLGVCGYEPSGSADDGSVIGRRRARLGSGMRLSYRRPLRAVSADGVWITDANGDRLLDAYNNVPHVGHNHPHVVAAIERQASKLNTNTRYLVDGVVAYAERLTGLFPSPLDVVFFANSGSEANDLAWRIARTVTGHRGMIVTHHAYHGSTYLTMATSPEELGQENLERWVATVPAPDSFRGPHRDRLDQGHRYAEAVEDSIERLVVAGEGVAAFACDTVFASDGIFDLPAGYLAGVYRRVRAAGGLCVADEVQAGFGRVGGRMWGFAADEAVPDVVTLGKPMGNGHPLAAVVTSSAIAEQFAEAGYYFSTFAGNPVSTAAGAAVLDVLEGDALAEQADRVGCYLRQLLRDLARTYPMIGDVRGPGMFVGVEVVGGEGEPDPATAHLIREEMRERRVLIGTTGAKDNVLKIRPPLVFDEQHADLLSASLEDVLRDVS